MFRKIMVMTPDAYLKDGAQLSRRVQYLGRRYLDPRYLDHWRLVGCDWLWNGWLFIGRFGCLPVGQARDEARIFADHVEIETGHGVVSWV